MKNGMRLGKEIYNLQRRRNKRKSNGAYFVHEKPSYKQSEKNLIVTIHRSRMGKENSHVRK
jgi:hypothetical protein